jgi:hypothetical protein
LWWKYDDDGCGGSKMLAANDQAHQDKLSGIITKWKSLKKAMMITATNVQYYCCFFVFCCLLLLMVVCCFSCCSCCSCWSCCFCCCCYSCCFTAASTVFITSATTMAMLGYVAAAIILQLILANKTTT